MHLVVRFLISYLWSVTLVTLGIVNYFAIHLFCFYSLKEYYVENVQEDKE